MHDVSVRPISVRPITVRRMEIEFPSDIEPVCVEGEPEESYGLIAFSLLLPYLEPYLIRKSLRFNLAFAEGFEALTTASARFALESGVFQRMHPAVGDLYAWHLVEELEHRTVAFDVYDHVCGGYSYRLGVGLFAQWHTLRFTGRVAAYLLAADPSSLSGYGGTTARRQRRRRQARMALRGLLPKVLSTYTPWYTPAKIAFTPEMESLARHYTALARGTS